MKLKLVLALTAMVAGTVAYADTLNSAGFNGSTGVFSPFGLGVRGSCSGTCIDGTPFFFDTSAGIVNGSAGDFLSASGAFTGGVNYMAGGGEMYTQAGNSPNFASAFSFIRQAAALQITLLYANSSLNNNTEFGIYDASSSHTNALNNHEIVQAAPPTGTLNTMIGQTYTVMQNYGIWGIYAKTCIIAVANQACPANHTVTYYSNVGMNSVAGDPAADSSHMHWALFQSGTNAAVYYLALEDFAITSGTRNPTEGYGAYNDLILRIDTSGIPEPATISIVGLGLAGLGVLGRRKLKK